MKKNKNYTFIDIFSGIGGFRIAGELNGGNCVFSSETNKYSKKTYLENFGNTPSGDISTIHADDIPLHDMLLAGFPCQPFSTAGKGEGFSHPTQGALFFDIVRILKHHKTKFFLLENVKGLIGHDKGKTFETIIACLKNELKYHVYHRVINSSDHGLPQNRERIYIVGFLKEKFDDEIKFKWPSNVLKKKYIGQFIEAHPEGYNITEHLQKNYLFKKDDGLPQVVDKNSKVLVRTLSASYYKIQRRSGTFVRDGNTGIRRLSVNECKSIMGFPVDFKVPVSRCQMYQQFGNAVTIPVVEKIIANILLVMVKE